ncbi:MAG: zf-HC2 domain-containing protein [Vicinamibacterales bacterium]
MLDSPHPPADLLSEYLDDELEGAERQSVEAHVGTCLTCRRELDALRAVTMRARTLQDRGPDDDLWPGIAERITDGHAAGSPRREVRRFSFTVPQLVAAGLALVVLTGALASLARLGGPRTDLPAVSAGDTSAADGAYDAAISDLQRSLDAGRSRLDENTLRVLDTNLAAIDDAIAQCRQALGEDPGNVYLNTYLAEARWRKLELLRHAAAIVEKSG